MRPGGPAHPRSGAQYNVFWIPAPVANFDPPPSIALCEEAILVYVTDRFYRSSGRRPDSLQRRVFTTTGRPSSSPSQLDDYAGNLENLIGVKRSDRYRVLTVLLKGRVGQIYNVGASCSLPNLAVVRKVLALMDRPEALIEYVTDRPGRDRR